MTGLMTEGRIRLGAEIQRRRKQLGLTQEELAQRMDVSRQSVTKWETGQSAPDLDRLVQLGELLAISLDELLKGPSEGSSEEQSDNGGETPPGSGMEERGHRARNRDFSSFTFFLRLSGGLLFFTGVASLLALWVLSIIFPVQLTEWDGSLHTGLDGYLRAHDYQPLLHAALGAAVGGIFCLLSASSSIRRIVARYLAGLGRRTREHKTDSELL